MRWRPTNTGECMVLNGQFGMSLLMTVLITVRVPDHSNWLQPTLLNNLKIAL